MLPGFFGGLIYFFGELFGCVEGLVVDPLFVLNFVVFGAEKVSLVLEGFDLFGGELPIQHLKIISY